MWDKQIVDPRHMHPKLGKFSGHQLRWRVAHLVCFGLPQYLDVRQHSRATSAKVGRAGFAMTRKAAEPVCSILPITLAFISIAANCAAGRSSSRLETIFLAPDGRVICDGTG
jgi:hypothetical protein